ncbi:hypothetical protein WANG_1835 [Lactobacillus kefiranofaciens subsp. kefiranofaciens]|nr:hypothetical protein WANG_1835 [Lactobacillus kefiranofaciens subsp. kefiranofaciens]
MCLRHVVLKLNDEYDKALFGVESPAVIAGGFFVCLSI